MDDLDDVEDAAVVNWFYDNKPLQFTKLVNGPSYRFVTWLLLLISFIPKLEFSHLQTAFVRFSVAGA